ncbi:hopanoid biosynthesis-associated protein HpnK, partial [Burkholderia pseudomallei]
VQAAGVACGGFADVFGGGARARMPRGARISGAQPS